MRALIQRVSKASVSVGSNTIGEIGQGYVILLGVGHEDTEAQADKLWAKISKLRIFEDHNGKANLSLFDISGEVMIVSQFTLYANCKKGNRPSFVEAGNPDEAERLYEYFIELAREDGFTPATGSFGEMMDVSLINDGPFTIHLDTDTL